MTKTRLALVTGSGKRRVGWHVAAALAQRGYSLALHYRTSAEEAQQSIDYFRELGVQVEAFLVEKCDDQLSFKIPARPRRRHPVKRGPVGGYLMSAPLAQHNHRDATPPVWPGRP